MREKAVATLARVIDGAGLLSFDAIRDRVYVGGRRFGKTLTLREYDERYDRAYAALVDSIDWNRVLIEACRRHLELDHPGDGYDGHLIVHPDLGVAVGALCPECLAEALLALDPAGSTDWKTQPTAPRPA